MTSHSSRTCPVSQFLSPQLCNLRDQSNLREELIVCLGFGGLQLQAVYSPPCREVPTVGLEAAGDTDSIVQRELEAAGDTESTVKKKTEECLCSAPLLHFLWSRIPTPRYHCSGQISPSQLTQSR